MGYTPPGAAGVGSGEPAIEIEEEDRTFLEKISEIPGAIYGALKSSFLISQRRQSLLELARLVS